MREGCPISTSMRLIRVGDKILSRDKITAKIDEILTLRASGLSQIDVAKILNVDRPFVSRLESLGEIAKGGKLALVGFPIGNKVELEKMAFEEGVEFVYILTDKERWSMVSNTDGAMLVNDLLELLQNLKNFDTIILLASNLRSQYAENIIGKQVISLEIGKSPIKDDVEVDVERVRKIIKEIRQKEGEKK